MNFNNAIRAFKPKDPIEEPTNESFFMNAPYTGKNIMEGEKIISKYVDPVVVYMPVGNYNDLKEFGRFKNLGVAMAIISSFNNPADFGGTPEYHIFSLETGAKIQLH